MILQQTKILTNQNQPEYFSMALDDRGYPHLSWVEQKNGHYDLVYKFWNGICWETLETEVLYRSDDEVTYSNIMIVNNEVLIIFTKKSYDNSIIGFIRIDQVVTEVIEYQTNGFVDWVGLITDKSEKERPYVISYESGSFKIYQLTDENLLLQSSIDYDVTDFDQIKIATTKDHFIVAINNENNIEFNFFDYTTNLWDNANFVELISSVTTGEIISFDLDGLNDSSQAGFTWIENNDSEKVHYLTTDSSGIETILDQDPIYDKETSLEAPEGFTIGGFTNVGLSYESDTNPHIVALGAQNVKFSYTTEWEQEVLGAPAKSESTVFVFNSFNIATISGGQIYFFEITDQPIVAQETNISLLNAKEFKTAEWSSGSLSTTILAGLDNYDNEVGDLLRDALRPVIVTASNEHPGFGSSSSETTLSSDSSQSNSSLSESSSTSEGYSESSSSTSEGYSESSSTSEGYSESSSSSIGYSESSSSTSSEGYSESSSSFQPMIYIYNRCFDDGLLEPSSDSSSSSLIFSESTSSGGVSNSSSSSLEIHWEYTNCGQYYQYELCPEEVESSSSLSMSSSSSTSSEIYSSSSDQFNDCAGAGVIHSRIYEEYQGDYIRICVPGLQEPFTSRCCWRLDQSMTLAEWIDLCGENPVYSDPNDIIEVPDDCFACLLSDSSLEYSSQSESLSTPSSQSDSSQSNSSSSSSTENVHHLYGVCESSSSSGGYSESSSGGNSESSSSGGNSESSSEGYSESSSSGGNSESSSFDPMSESSSSEPGGGDPAPKVCSPAIGSGQNPPPDNILKITAAIGDLPKTWCGTEWVNEEADGGPASLGANQVRNGTEARACPTTYNLVFNTVQVSPSIYMGITASHIWEASALKIGRRRASLNAFAVTCITYNQQNAMSVDGVTDISYNNGCPAPFNFNNFSLGLISGVSLPTSGDYRIGNSASSTASNPWFNSYTIGTVTYTWRRGDNWPA